MTEINKAQNVSLQNVDLTLPTERTQVDETEDMNIFGAQSDKKDIGDIHGTDRNHKYGNINNTRFDIRISDHDVKGDVNGKKVDLDYQTPFFKPNEYVGYVGDKKVKMQVVNGGFNKRSYQGTYGDKKFNLEFSDKYNQAIKGKFGNQQVDVTILENTFKADDVFSVDNLPKDMEEFFPVIYTLMNSENGRSSSSHKYIPR